MTKTVLIKLDLNDYGDIDYNCRSFMDQLIAKNSVTIKSYTILEGTENDHYGRGPVKSREDRSV